MKEKFELLELKVNMLAQMVQDQWRLIADIYEELELVDDDKPLGCADVCDWDPHVGHVTPCKRQLVEEKHRI